MKLTRLATTMAASVLIAAPLAACSTDSTTDSASSAAVSTTTESAAASTPSQILSSTAWETTGAVDQNGAHPALTDSDVAAYVGYAYFQPDGTFTMFTLDDAPKMQGDWTVTPDGKTRTIVAKDPAGKVLFTRDSPITELTPEVFTYRTYPDPKNTAEYIDIIHTPTTHARPRA
ncbi:MAG: DUF4822 domain-containing protein [Gordonia sp. (in: high G+C Gram-positive bacteria)]|uniref:DUF4822 domain-containing protein n=1 Tax=Gordonia sp. (in: high G+C Gram-positive bacteria) TaxID=84139 RepID=UPI003C77DA4E